VRSRIGRFAGQPSDDRHREAIQAGRQVGMLRPMRDLKRFEGPAYTALRIVAGALFMVHGISKIFHWQMPGPPLEVGSQVWIGGLIELIGGGLIAVGLFTRLAAFICSGTMAVAYIQFHWKLAFADWKWLPMVNQGEMAVLYCFVFLFIAAHGAGQISLDRKLRNTDG
jgi:putative oxidoreductase